MSELFSIDPELAAKADTLFRELGLDLSTAIQLFLLQSLREHGLPFTPRLTPPSAAHNAQTQEDSTEDVRCRKEPVRRSESNDFGPAAAVGKNDEEKPENTPGSSEEQTSDEPGIHDEALLSTSDNNDAFSEADAKKHDIEEADNAESGAFEQKKDVSSSHEEGGELRQAFLNARLIGAPLRRVRSLNRIYSIGEPNPQVHGWREVYVSGDEPFALDFGIIRVELGFHGGGSLRMMDGRLPDSVLEADAVYPRDLSAVFSSVIGQRLVDVASSRIWNEGREREQLCLRFANGCTLNFAPGGEWGALWLTDVHGSVMFAPEAVWLRVLDDRTRSGLR